MLNAKFNALIVDPDPSSRLRLRQAMSAVVSLQKVTQCSDTSEAARLIESARDYDLMFLSKRLDLGKISSFIDQIKSMENGRDLAFVIVQEKDDQASGKLALSMLGGADGFLVEPFSVDSLVETTILSTQVKKKRAIEREQAAISLLIKEIISQLDVYAQLRAGGHEAKISQRNLADMCSALKHITPESLDFYYEEAVRLFMNAPIPKPAVKIYAGASNRVKKRTEQKLNQSAMKDFSSEQLKKSHG